MTAKQQFKQAFRMYRLGDTAFGSGLPYAACRAAYKCAAARNYRDPLNETTAAHRLGQRRDLAAIFGA